MSAATILHADLDAFYASVEQRDDPALRGRPVIVGKGVVLAASYEAKAKGVYTTMNGGEAQRRCPEAVFVDPRMKAYSAASKEVYEIFAETSPLVEGLSIDEAFLDVRGLERISGTPAQIAARLRREVLERVGLRITVGVARTKFLAKVASGAAKPDGLLLVEPDEELAFLHPLPIQALWGVGKVTSGKLNRLGIATVGELAAYDEVLLKTELGENAAARLLDLANNRDPRRVKKRERRRSIGAQSACRRASRTIGEVESLAASLVDRVCGRMRKAGRTGRTVVIRLRFDDFTRASRSLTLPHPTDETDAVLAAVRQLLTGARPLIEARGMTLLGVAVENLEDDVAVQMELPVGSQGTHALDAALDDVRARFGADAIKRASMVRADEGVSVPLLPDD